MKKILLFGIVLLFHFVANAQFSGPIHVVNKTGCQFFIGLFASSPGNNCQSPNYSVAPVPIQPVTTLTFTMASIDVGSPLPPPVGTTWEYFRIYDGCAGGAVGDPTCSGYNANATVNFLGCCGIRHIQWDISTQTVTIY